VKVALIGHRGIGKTSLLKRMARYFPELSPDKFVCLDQYIETQSGIKIKDVFEKQGEEAFRKLESQALAEILEAVKGESHFVLAIGAGCLQSLPEGWTTVWVQRGVASENFCFLDRPSLDKGLKIDIQRHTQRSQFYRSQADLCWTLDEHNGEAQEEERLWSRKLLGFQKSCDLPENLFYTPGTEPATDLSHFKALELRDDLLSSKEINRYLKNPRRRSILSFRDAGKVKETKLLLNDSVTWDWPIEFGECDFGRPSILSCHSKELFESGQFFREGSRSPVLKLAIPVEGFEDLIQGHRWFLEDPSSRVFLPISKTGRWQWYRQWMSPKMKFQFFRMGETSLKDQPTLMQSLRIFDSENFAAVLGSPVAHSLTPWFHRQFFEVSNQPVFAIAITEEEWNLAIPFLQELGLSHAAVTSPLKKKAQGLVNAEHSVNTLFFDGSTWQGVNTDPSGLIPWQSRLKMQTPALWGGGGIIDSVVAAFGDVQRYSSRTGELKAPKPCRAKPTVLLWAVGAQAFSQQGCFPPEDWPLEVVYDLNYTEDSPGRECAARFGCRYESGLEMFMAQAREQQKFWRTCVSK